MSENFIFKLSQELTYTKDGNPDCKTCTLEFSNPGMDVYDQITDLSQMVMNATMEASKNAPKEAIEKAKEEASQENKADKIPDASEMKAILFSAKETKFSNIAKNFKVLCLATCTLDGSAKLTEPLISRMEPKDWTKLVCEYIAFFIAPSLFSEEV